MAGAGAGAHRAERPSGRPMTVTETPPRILPGMQGDRAQRGLLRVVVALGLLAFWAAYYAWCLFPGLGGVMNAGDTAKFQGFISTSTIPTTK